ncbi:MAG: hypothetical protein HYT86_03515 [candidate division NC10 bacterium]|nr:hypothetical protein [candidate division NC10 bacterium]
MGRPLRAACRRIRCLRGLRAAVRGASLCLLAGLPFLLFRSLLPMPAPLLLAALTGLGAVGGFALGLLRRLDPFDAARLLDGRLDLQDRLATGVELARLPTRRPVEAAALAEAAATEPDRRRALPIGVPGRDLARAGAALAAALLLLALPPIPWDRAMLAEAPEDPTALEEEQAPSPRTAELPRAAGPLLADAVRPPERGMSQSLIPPTHATGEEAAEFRDTPLSGRRPDFGSFIRQGDDRLKLLGKPDSLPDLKQDFTRSPYQVAVGRMREMLGERSLKDLSAEELKRLLSELERVGRRGTSGLYGDDFSMDEGGSGGSREEALRNLERALSQLRGRGEGRGGSELESTGRLPRLGGENAGEGMDGFESDMDGMGGAGSLPGTGASPSTRGIPTPRLRGGTVDTALRGQARDGPTESYNTNVVGRGDRGTSRLPQTQVLTRYRQMMEEALTKEPIPPDYREQVKKYFDSLEALR